MRLDKLVVHSLRDQCTYYYLRQGGYVIVVVCLFVRLFVCLLSTLRKNFRTDVHEIFREDWQWVSERLVTF